MRIVMHVTPQEKARGLIGLKPIPSETLFIFPRMMPGDIFHSNGVLEPFEIYFLDSRGLLVSYTSITPPDGIAFVPENGRTVVEAKTGTLRHFGAHQIEEAVRDFSHKSS